MKLDIPGLPSIEIRNVVFDYNGTIALNGKLIEGVSESINRLADRIGFHVITADTFGTVKQELKNTKCRVITIPEDNQDTSKQRFIHELGRDSTLAVGNGRNDTLMLKEAALGIALLLDEGLCTETLLNSDILCRSIFDVFAYFETPKRLIATLRN